MITYVNTVLVGTGVGSLVSAAPTTSDSGKYVVISNTGDQYGNVKYLDATSAATAERIRVGYVTGDTTIKIDPSTKAASQVPVIKWSNWIDQKAIKSYSNLTYTADTQDTVVIDFTGATLSDLLENRIVVRITYKDLPTRYRKWSESYDLTVSKSDTLATIATKIANKINGEYKRARVSAVASGNTVTLTAMEYTDDNAVDTINVAETVRFTVNMWMTKPKAAGFDSKNKYSIDGAVITKTPGKIYPASWKLVRDAEAQAMGYQGILNRGEGTWPIIKPEMLTEKGGQYDAITLEFENKYNAADDIKRNTKQTLQIFEKTTKLAALKAVLDAFVQGEHSSVALGTSDDEPGV